MPAKQLQLCITDPSTHHTSLKVRKFLVFQ